MCKDDKSTLTDEEKLLKEKAKQSLNKNKTPTYASDDEGGLLSGPLTSKDMEEQAEEQDEQNKE